MSDHITPKPEDIKPGGKHGVPQETADELRARAEARREAVRAEIDEVRDAFDGIEITPAKRLKRETMDFSEHAETCYAKGTPLVLRYETFLAIGRRINELSEIVRQNAMTDLNEARGWASAIEEAAGEWGPTTPAPPPAPEPAERELVTIPLPPLDGES